MKAIAKEFLRRTSRARSVHAIVLTRVIVGALLLSGCVAAPAYEQANSAADVASEGRRRAQLEMAQVKAELARLTLERDALAEKLQTEEDAAARARLDVTTTQSERDQQAELVVQLQSELGRVAEHLKNYADERDQLSGEKQRLELELSAAQAKTTDEVPSEPAVEEPPAEVPLDAPSAASEPEPTAAL